MFRHVTPNERHGKRYRNMASVFSIGEGDSDESVEEHTEDASTPDELSRPRLEKVKLSQWLKQPDIRERFECQQVDDRSLYLYPRYFPHTLILLVACSFPCS